MVESADGSADARKDNLPVANPAPATAPAVDSINQQTDFLDKGLTRRRVPLTQTGRAMVTRIRWIVLTVCLMGLALLLVSVVNYKHIEGGIFNHSAQTLIERSRVISAKARPGYETQALSNIPPNPNNGPFYRFDDKLPEATVLAEPTGPDNTEAFGVLYSFEFEEEEESFSGVTDKSVLKQEDGVLAIKHARRDYLINQEPIMIPRDEIGEIAIRMRARKGKHIRLGWAGNPDPKEPWVNSIAIPIVADNEFHSYFVNANNALKRGLKSGESIRGLFLKPSDIDGDDVEIDFIRFVSKRSKYMRKPRGVAYETIAKEMRQVLYMLPDQTLQYTVTIPEKSPRLDFGTAVLIDNEPLRFRVQIGEGAEAVTVYEQNIEAGSKWSDVALDLTRWAGKQVRVSISVDGSQHNVGYWSNPIVSSAPVKPFNVILLLEDALRADHLSTYGYRLPTTPFKDRRMEREGIVFLNAISQAEKTRPSVPSIMTSLLPTATNVWHFTDMLSDEYLTLAEIMRNQGFVTASFVQNGNAGPYAGLHQGFSTLFDQETIGSITEDLFGERLMAWLARNRDRNFFLYLHVADPHGVYDPPSPYDRWYRQIAPGQIPEEFDDSLDAKWVRQPTLEGRRYLYDGEIRHNDAVISGFVEKLKELQLYDNTLLVFISDHGEHLGEHGFWNYRVWEHSPPGFLQVLGVPFMIVYPKRFSEPKRIPETVQLLDIMPTLLDLARVEISGLLMQGDSLVDLMEGHRLPEWRNRIIVSEEPTAMDKREPSRNEGLSVSGSLFYRDWHFLASRRLLLARAFVPASLTLQAFDLASDREEAHPAFRFFPDLYLRYKYAAVLNEVQANGRAAWRKWTNGGEGQVYSFDPDVLEHLKALGYIE